MIQKGKLHKYVKKGEYSNFKGGNKNQREFSPRNDDRPRQPPQDIIGVRGVLSLEGHSGLSRKYARDR